VHFTLRLVAEVAEVGGITLMAAAVAVELVDYRRTFRVYLQVQLSLIVLYQVESD